MSDDNIHNYFETRIEDLNEEIRDISIKISDLRDLMRAKEMEIKFLRSGVNKGPHVAFASKRRHQKGANGQTSLDRESVQFQELGFRDAVRVVLRNSGRRMKPKEVAAEFRRRGYPYNAKVDLTTRMSNELNRMAKSGHLRKGKGWYALEDTEEGLF